ncbi:diaminopropionate ammonia-lyase [Microbacterium enclense]|uniref:Diaminopropionate ammonia-lyase n=1 Tax=Microbacterium enclense TaxID=993073 RepID=A0A1G6JGT5_9MICO|nr:diaminopropionate ammonia-lyase [Microbacterium enclense]KSU54840.1 PLP-dependent lyase/thiolase [Microbacterium enclense]SDC17873.1 diaminopropionate ammonia-lyase [Microbacterium enclense]
MSGFYDNPRAREWRTLGARDVSEFHRGLPGYAPTRLVEVPEIAAELGVARVFVKEESSRLGLPAFKVLGASYAVSRALSTRIGHSGALPLDELRGAAGGVRLVTATDGNHGRAVAHVARLLGISATIFTPVNISQAAKDAIEAEGARRVEVDAEYDDVVRAAASLVDEGAMLIQDTSWDGYEEVPGWIVEGYTTLVIEADMQGAEVGAAEFDVVFVPVGVGSLAEAVVRHYRSGSSSPSVVSVEPTAAPAVLTSLNAGERRAVRTSSTIMAGLNCGTPSATAWPTLRDGLDRAVAVTDEQALAAVSDLAASGIDAGPCGAAALAGARALASHLSSAATLLLLSTEGRAANPVPVHA